MKKRFTHGLYNADLVLDCLAVGPGQTVIDAGCGSGYMSKKFSVKVGPSGTVYALDQDAGFIEELKTKINESNIKALVTDITNRVPIQASCIDLVYLSAVFHAFSRLQINGFILEARRLLKPGGVLAIVEIEKRETPFGHPLNQDTPPGSLWKPFPLPPGRLFRWETIFICRRLRTVFELICS